MRWFCFSCSILFLTSWGFKAHRTINEQAVYQLPDELYLFYKNHVGYISEHAVDADVKKFANHQEVPNHFIDLEYYFELFGDTISNVTWEALNRSVSKDSLHQFGILPWHVEQCYKQLIISFQNQNSQEIKKLSADIGHYIADANVPLHATVNYDGQLSHQEGVHALFETHAAQLLMDTLFLRKKAVDTISNFHEFIWDVVLESHQKSKELLQKEQVLRKRFKGELYDVAQNENAVLSSEYVEYYYQNEHEFLASCFKKAIFEVRNVWYSAWLKAGKPKLSEL